MEVDALEIVRGVLGKTKGLTVLAHYNKLERKHVAVIDYNYAIQIPIPTPTRKDDFATLADCVAGETKVAMKTLAAEIYANIRPWLDEPKNAPTPEPRKPEVWSFLACPQVELNQ